MNKEKVTAKIMHYCDKYNIAYPDFNNYDDVKKCADKINSTCPFCGKDKGGSSVICICEIGASEDD